MCLTNKAVLSFFDRSGSRLKFVNIREPSYTASEHGGVEFADAMRHFHVVEADGDIATGSDAVLAAYSKVGARPRRSGPTPRAAPPRAHAPPTCPPPALPPPPSLRWGWGGL